MRYDTPAQSSLGMVDMRKRFFVECLTLIRRNARIVIAGGMLVCFVTAGLCASSTTNPIPGGLTVRRSMRAAPHRLVVHPNGATVAADQIQHFAVTDAQGKPVVVHWNVSGIGCSGAACGTINEQGVYQPPSSLPQPNIVTVEGVLASDPNYSVLTEVKLEPAVSVSVTPAVAANVVKQPEQIVAPSAPKIERQLPSRNVALPPAPHVIPAPPVLESQSRRLARSGELPPLPNVIAAAPGIGSQSVPRTSQLLPLPNAVTSAPIVETSATRKRELPPLPGVVAATPSLERTNVASRGVMPALPNVIAAAPVIENRSIARNAQLPSLPNAVAAAPQIEKRNVHSIELPLANVVIAGPATEKRSVSKNAQVPPPPASVIAAALAPAPPNVARVDSKSAVSLELLASAHPPTAPIYGARPQQFTDAQAVRKNAGSNVPLPPMQDGVAISSTAGFGSPQHHSAVTYSNGQLTINAENLSLAAVLKLVAEKTGAIIEVPPGAGLERIVEHAGPGRPEDVLAALLNGSPFDFVIVGSPQGSDVPTQVLLSMHHAGDTPATPPIQTAKTSSPTLWNPPPADTTTPVILPADLDSRNLQPPKEPIDPAVLGQMMKDRAQQLRERLQQQQ